MSKISTPSPTGTKNSEITTPSKKSSVDTLNNSGSTAFKNEHGVAPNAESVANHERKLSTDSSTTVESESWNPYDPVTLKPLLNVASSTGYAPKFSTDSTSTIEPESWDAYDPKTAECEVKAALNTAYPRTSPLSCFNTAVVGMSPLETLERYQLPDYGAGNSEQGTRIHDFSYPAGIPEAKHLHLELTADHAALPLYRWKEGDKDTTDLDAIEPHLYSFSNAHTICADKQNDKPSYPPFPSPKRALDINHARVQHNDTHVSDPTSTKKPTRTHRLLRSISESLSNLASAHAGTAVGISPRKAWGQAYGLSEVGTVTGAVTNTNPTVQTPHSPRRASTDGSPVTRKRRRLGDRLLGALRIQKDMQDETQDSANI